MTMTRRSAWIVAVVAAIAGAAGDEPAAPEGPRAADLAKEPAAPPDLHPKAPEPVPPEALEATIKRRGGLPPQGPEQGRLLGHARADQGRGHHRRHRLAPRLPAPP